MISEDRIRRMMQQLGWDTLSEEELLDAVSEQMDLMVKAGQVERLIGEDGGFYYRSIAESPDRFQFLCPICKHGVKLPPNLIGRLGRCSGCSNVVPILLYGKST